MANKTTPYSQECGQAGVHTVDLATGNSTFTFGDGGFDGGSRPALKISHVYLSKMKGERYLHDNSGNTVYFNEGRGWKLNIEQFCYRSGNDYLYANAGGELIRLTEKTECVWDQEQNKPMEVSYYSDDENRGLTCREISAGSCIVTDAAGNELSFTDSRLHRITNKTQGLAEESDRDKIEIAYCGGMCNAVVSVTDNLKHKAAFEYEDTTNSLLRKITFQTDGVTTGTASYSYDASQRLTKVTYRAGSEDTSEDNVVRFEYGADYALAAVTDRAGLRHEIAYTGGKAAEVAAYATAAKIDGTFTAASIGKVRVAGGKTKFAYGTNTASVTDEYGNVGSVLYLGGENEVRFAQSDRVFDGSAVIPVKGFEYKFKDKVYTGAVRVPAGAPRVTVFGVSALGGDSACGPRRSKTCTAAELGTLAYKGGDGIVLSGWAKASPSNPVQFAVSVTYSDGTGERANAASCNTIGTGSWQYVVCGVRVPNGLTVKTLTAEVSVSTIGSSVTLSDVALYKGDCECEYGIPQIYSSVTTSVFGMTHVKQIVSKVDGATVTYTVPKPIGLSAEYELFEKMKEVRCSGTRYIDAGGAVRTGKVDKTYSAVLLQQPAGREYSDSIYKLTLTDTRQRRIVTRGGCVQDAARQI